MHFEISVSRPQHVHHESKHQNDLRLIFYFAHKINIPRKEPIASRILIVHLSFCSWRN